MVNDDPADPLLPWCRAAGTVLAHAAARALLLASAVAADWLDDHGREWAERAASLHRELARTARDVDDLTRELSLRDHAPDVAATLRGVAAQARRTGPCLGGTDGARTDDGHGVRIAELPEPGGG